MCWILQSIQEVILKQPFKTDLYAVDDWLFVDFNFDISPRETLNGVFSISYDPTLQQENG